MPNRIIKESICTSDSLSQLSDFEENLFYKLIVNCDDYGRLDARPAILKSRCYPLRDRLRLDAIQDALLQLARVGCVELYQVDSKPYLRLPSWEAHQQIRAKKSKFPAPDSNGYQMISDDDKCSRNPIQSESNPNRESESNANTGADAPKRSRFVLPTVDEVADYCRERNNSIDAQRWFDHYVSNGWMVGKSKMKDWRAAVRTWEKNDYSNSPRGPSPKESDNIFLEMAKERGATL